MISHFFIDRPIFAAVVSIVFVIIGAVSFWRLPIAQYPEIAPPIINVQGCPHIAEVMAGVVVQLLAFERIPQLDGLGRPKAFYSCRVHDTC